MKLDKLILYMDKFEKKKFVWKNLDKLILFMNKIEKKIFYMNKIDKNCIS